MAKSASKKPGNSGIFSGNGAQKLDPVGKKAPGVAAALTEAYKHKNTGVVGGSSKK